MARSSFLYLIDVAMRSLVYTKFGSFLNINTQSSIAADNINKGVLLIPKGVAQREVAEKRGEVYLDFVNLWRTGEEFSWSRNKTFVARTGMSLQSVDPTQTITARAVPADLAYSIWFWSRDLDKLGQCIEEYLFWTHQFPKLSIMLNDLYPLEFDLHFGASVDESPIDEKYKIGPYFVRHVTVNVDALIFKITSKGDIFRKILVNCYDSQNILNTAVVNVEDSNYDVDVADAVRMFQAKLFGIDFVNLSAQSLGIRKDFTADFTSGQVFFLENSTGNNGRFTVVSSSYVGGVTTIIVNEPLLSSVADGNLYIP